MDSIECEDIGEPSESDNDDEEDDDSQAVYKFVETRQIIQKAGNKNYGPSGYLGPESG